MIPRIRNCAYASFSLFVCRKEISSIRGTLIIRGILLSFNIVSRFSIFLSLGTYVYMGNIFTARQVFIVTSYFNFLYDSMLHFWPIALTSAAECYVSIKRIEQFLLLPETKSQQLVQTSKAQQKDKAKEKQIEDKYKSKLSNTLNGLSKEHINMGFMPDVLSGGLCEKLPSRKLVCINENSNTKGVIFRNVTATWGQEAQGQQTGIESINLEIQSNRLCAIIGSVGSGKSTVLQAMLREIEIDAGELIINGVVSYASQEPWLFEGTVRQNIIFTEQYEEKRYKEVIRVCALERDLQMLPYGDYTIVGERGISLSGGQKARVNLARAIYRKADIYLLDDPLSAVDTLVGKHIFQNCVKTFLRDKACVLVTHQVQYLKKSSHVVLMNSGRIEAQGNYSDIKHAHTSSLRRMSSSVVEVETKKAKDSDIQVSN